MEDEQADVLARVGSTEDGALRWAQGSPEQYERLSEIDPYGITLFNTLQLKVVIHEWQHLLDETQNERECAWLVEVLGLLRRAEAATHTYVRFNGD
jgi:hypothetical protein